MFLVPGQKAPRSIETSMKSSGWGVPAASPSQPTRGSGERHELPSASGDVFLIFLAFPHLSSNGSI